MKKSLIALAVAGAFAAPAFAATSNVDVYGQIRMSLDYLNNATGSEDNWAITDRVSRIGFKGSEDLGGGMKAVWQIEQQITIDNGGAAGGGTAFGGASLRNTFVGLAGGFGTVLAGRHDTPYKLVGSADLFGDTAADAQQSTGIIGSQTTNAVTYDLRTGNTIAYVSPTWSGFHFAAAVIPGEVSTLGTKQNSLADAYSLAFIYVNGPLNVGLGYEDHGDIASATLDEHAWKLNAGYAIGDLKLGATYESQNDAGAANRDVKAYLVSAAYGMGPITLLAQYGNRDSDLNTSDLRRWTVGVGYSLSKRTSTYVAWNDDDANNVDSSALTIGLNHSF